MQQQILPGIVPTALIRMDVLLGPSAEIVAVQLEVRDAAGKMVALRSFPSSKYTAAVDLLDKAWRELLDAMPPGSWTVHYDQLEPKCHNRNPTDTT